MKKLTSALCAIAMLTGASVAMAAETSGTIKTIDTEAKTFTLDNDSVFMAGDKLDLKTLKVGEKVEVSFEKKEKVNEASSVKALK